LLLTLSRPSLSAHYTPGGDIHQTHAPIELFRSAAARVRRKQKLFAAGRSTFSICGDERVSVAFGRSEQMEFGLVLVSAKRRKLSLMLSKLLETIDSLLRVFLYNQGCVL
jgi:hypothetical protein